MLSPLQKSFFYYFLLLVKYKALLSLKAEWPGDKLLGKSFVAKEINTRLINSLVLSDVFGGN